MRISSLSILVATVGIILGSSLPASAAGPAAPQSGVVPAGAFAVDLMRAAGVPEAGWKSEASRLLARAGVDRPELPLTEGIAASMMRELGLEVVSSTPAREVSGDRAESFVRQAGGLLAPAGSADPVSARIGSVPAPGSFEDCLAVSRNHGKCVNCCKDLDPAPPTNACTRLCVSFTGKPSASEPLP